MNFIKENGQIAFLLLTVLIFTLGTGKQVRGQEVPDFPTEEPVPVIQTEEPAPAIQIEEPIPVKQIKRILIGPHPKYTCLLVNVVGPVEYQVSANFLEKKNCPYF